MNIIWQEASHEKITITKDEVRIKIGPRGNLYKNILLSIAEEAYNDFIDSKMEFTVRGALEEKSDHLCIKFQSQHGHSGNKKVSWKTYQRSI